MTSLSNIGDTSGVEQFDPNRLRQFLAHGHRHVTFSALTRPAGAVHRSHVNDAGLVTLQVLYLPDLRGWALEPPHGNSVFADAWQRWGLVGCHTLSGLNTGSPHAVRCYK